MKKKVLLALVSTTMVLTACGAKEAGAPAAKTTEAATAAEAENTVITGEEISNSLFTITIPAECEGTYEADIQDDQITIFEKEAKAEGYGGMAFTVWARELPSEFAGGPYTKKGEITGADGKKYEVVLGYATEVQWNFEKSEEAPEAYDKLYNAADLVVENMKGTDGNTFEYGAGCKGEDLYGDIVEKYKTAFDEGWDAAKYEENDMSPELFALTKDGGLENVGIAYFDVNLDGIDEMFVGTLKDDEIKGTVYDIYTMVDGVPTHVVSGNARDRYYAYNSFIVNEFSGGAQEYGKNVYDLPANDTELNLQWATKYDAYENEKQPWFICYSDEKWENVSEEDFTQREAASDDYTKLDYKPLSEIK